MLIYASMYSNNNKLIVRSLISIIALVEGGCRCNRLFTCPGCLINHSKQYNLIRRLLIMALSFLYYCRLIFLLVKPCLSSSGKLSRRIVSAWYLPDKIIHYVCTVPDHNRTKLAPKFDVTDSYQSLLYWFIVHISCYYLMHIWHTRLLVCKYCRSHLYLIIFVPLSTCWSC